MSEATISVHLNKHRRLVEWARLFAGYSCVQVVAQGLGFLAGIIVVRSLSKEDYACFLIVNTIGPVMNMLSDNGITNSLSAIGGRFWKDDERMGSLVKTAMTLRKRLVLLSFLVVTPVLIWMLRRNHCPNGSIAWLVPITLAGVFLQLNIGMLSAVVNLRQQVGRMQALVIAGMLPRLVLIGSLAAMGWLNAPLAVAVGTIVLGIQYLLLDRWVKPQISLDAPLSEGFKTDILAIVKRQAPLTIYFCLQSQIGIWLISIFGNAHRVAEVGALGRIGMIFSVLVSTTSALVVPRFARAQDLRRLRQCYATVLFGFSGAILLGSALAWLRPDSLLWLLGSKYSQLGSLVWLAVLAAGSSALTGLLYSLNVNKGWIPPAAIVIPAEIVSQVFLCLYFDLSSVRDVLLIGILGPAIPGFINLVVTLVKLNSAARIN